MLMPMSAEQPWLENASWAENGIASDARRAHWVMWGFAGFWNLVTLPLFFQLGEIWQKILIRDQSGNVHLLDYQMIQTSDGWRINGVQLLRAPDVGA